MSGEGPVWWWPQHLLRGLRCLVPRSWHVGGKRYWEETVGHERRRELSTGLRLVAAAAAVIAIGVLTAQDHRRWQWELVYWSVRGRRLRSTGGTPTDNHVFISYSHDDAAFVRKLVSVVEGEWGLRARFYERDFPAGELITAAVVEAVAGARAVVLVVSASAAASPWCLWEAEVARGRLLLARRPQQPPPLLLVRLDQPPPAVTRTLRLLLSARPPLDWPEDSDSTAQAIFWQRLREAILAPETELEEQSSEI